MTAGAGTTSSPAADNPASAARRLARSERLSRRRFEILPLTGPAAAFTEVQGRQPGSPSVAPEDLAELISSIATVGVLQPVLVEELDDGRRRLVAGERRLRAAKWLATDQPDVERYQTIPAVVCPGPLPEEDRRVWQLVENLAREDLRPGELAAALLFERCSVLTGELLAAGVTVPADIAAVEDPVARFRALDRLRLKAGQSRLGAPWPEVLRRLGVQITKRKAQQLVRAFAALPAEISEEMDAAKIALHTRLRYLELDRGNRQAAADIWEAVKQRDRPELLTGAVCARLADERLDPDTAVDAAAEVHEAANAARQQAARTGPGDAEANEPRGATTPPALPTDPDDDEPDPDGKPSTGAMPAELARNVTAGLRRLNAALLQGAELAAYDAGSLRLSAGELLELLERKGSATESHLSKARQMASK